MTRQKTVCALPASIKIQTVGLGITLRESGRFLLNIEWAKGFGSAVDCPSTNGQLSQLRIFTPDYLVCPPSRGPHHLSAGCSCSNLGFFAQATKPLTIQASGAVQAIPAWEIIANR